MAKGETKKTNQMLDKDRAQSNAQYSGFINPQTQRSEESYGRQTQAYNDAYAGYAGLAQGNLLPGMASPGGGYGVARTNFGGVLPTYNEFMNTGGIDPSKMRVANSTLEEIMGSGGFSEFDNSAIDKAITGYQRLADTGGINEADRTRMRGGGVFDEFSKTGGLSQGDIGNIRSRAGSTLPAMYGGLQDEMSRQRRISGGNTAMGNATALRLARERSRAIADQSLNTELGISDQVRTGRQWGAEGMAQSEGALQGLISSNTQAGLAGASGTAMNRSNSRAGNRLNAGGQLAGIEANIQDMTQRGRMYGTDALRGIAETQAAEATRAGAVSAGAADADARFRAQMQLEGLGGLMNLRGQDLGAGDNYDARTLAAIQGNTGQNLEGLGMRYGAPGNNKGVMDYIGQGLGIAGGVAGAFMPGAGGLATGLMKKRPLLARQTTPYLGGLA